ncbi:MAG: GNAT family N-acetyltransferase [Pelosinus sp.]|nr:GNAT family N-acetyltransferase [Pelosinus sp.]
MKEATVKITELSLSTKTEIPKNILAIIENSLVYSINELALAKESKKIMYIASTENGELIGYCIVTVAYPYEVAEELKTAINNKVLWVDVLEIANSYQGNNYGRTLIDYIRNRYSYDLLLLSTAEAICFWQQMGLDTISCSGEMAYMIS